MKEGTLEDNLEIEAEKDDFEEKSEDDVETEEDSEGDDVLENEVEESIGKLRLGVASSNFSVQPVQEIKRGGLEKEVFTNDGDLVIEDSGIDLIEEKYRTEDREREEREDESVKYGSKEEGFYNESSKNHYNESSLSRGDDDFEIEIGSRDLKDLKNEEFYSLRKDKEDRENSTGLFRSESRTYFERKEKEYLA